MSSLLEANGLSYSVRQKSLVENASLALDPGEIVAIVGPNGAGKSTLFKLLAGELKLATGELRYGGEPIAGLPPWRLACLRAVLPQSVRLFLPLRVYEVASLGFDGIGKNKTRAWREETLHAALTTAEVLHLAARNYLHLSGGEQQRVQFSRVLCQLAAGRSVVTRQILFLDEPTANLDLSHQIALLEAARHGAADGLGVIIVMHDLNLAAAFCDRMIAMQAGRIVASGPPFEVVTDALLPAVFGVLTKVRAVPAAPTPFVLPERQRRR